LTLGSASTHLKVNDALALSGIALETGAGSLSLSGALALSNNAALNSSGGTITLVSGASAPSGTSISLPNTTLVLENPLSLTGATLKTNGTTFTTNANALSLSNSSILEVEGVQNLGGVFPDNSTTLRLAANSTIDDNASLSVGTLDLANFALTLDNAMAGLSIAQLVTLDAAGEKIVTGNADLALNGGISATAGTLSSTGGTLSLPGGATLASGASFSTSNTTLNLGGSLAVADTWTSTSTSVSLTTDNASLSSTVPLSLASLQTNGHDFELASAASDLTIENAFALSGGETLSTQGADLIFESSADISPGSTLDASGGGKLEFQQGGTDNGTINAENATFKIGSAYAVPGTLKTNGSTTWTLGTVNLDLSGGTLELGGNLVVLDKVLTDNLTTFKLVEDATVTRNEGFTLGGLDLDNSTLTLGSATTDLTLDIGDSSDNGTGSGSSDNGTGSGSPSGTLATVLADLTFTGGFVDLPAGITLSSTDGKITFEEGGAVNGGTLNLQNSTLAVGSSFSKTGGSLTLTGTDLELLSDLSLSSDAAVTVDELRLKNKTLTHQSESSFTVADLLVLNNSNERIIWDNNTALALSGGLRLMTNGELTWKNPGNLAIGNI